MKIKNLKLKNVGPFREAELDFPQERDVNGKIPVTIITGENGTGKSVIIDAIRFMFNHNANIGRDIVPNHNDFLMEMTIDDEGEKVLSAISFFGKIREQNNTICYYFSGKSYEKNTGKSYERQYPNWVVDYWNSNLSNDSFRINSLSSINLRHALVGALDGGMSNVELTNFICSVDYLRSSDDQQEAEVGNYSNYY